MRHFVNREACSSSCGAGAQQRSRLVAQVANDLGQDCTGEARQSRPCKGEACPSCQTSDWSHLVGFCSRIACLEAPGLPVRGLVSTRAHAPSACVSLCEQAWQCLEPFRMSWGEVRAMRPWKRRGPATVGLRGRKRRRKPTKRARMASCRAARRRRLGNKRQR